MQIPSTLAATLGPSASAAFTLLGRLVQTRPSLSPESAPLLSPESVPLIRAGGGTLTPDMIRAALLEMGVGAAQADVALAAALAQTGLPLTAATLAEAHGALARAPGATPEAYALAKSLALPATPDALKALTAALTAPANGLPAGQALPDRVREWLGLDMDAGAGPEVLARHLRERMLETGRSTEHRILSALRLGEPPHSVEDARTALLRLVSASGEPSVRAEADTLAWHLEGQQLLNQAALQAHASQPETPLYLAVPLVFGAQPTLAEMQIWTSNRRAGADGEEEPDAAILRVTVRVAPPRLGRVQAELTGQTTGNLICRLGVEKAGAMRLLARHAGTLASAFSDAGWHSCDVCCRLQPDWPPLWQGGAALTTPRTCVDRHV